MSFVVFPSNKSGCFERNLSAVALFGGRLLLISFENSEQIRADCLFENFLRFRVAGMVLRITALGHLSSHLPSSPPSQLFLRRQCLSRRWDNCWMRVQHRHCELADFLLHFKLTQSFEFGASCTDYRSPC